MAAFSDDVSFATPTDGGTEVRMTFLVRPNGRRRVTNGVPTKGRRVHPPPAGV
jgi:hypothetical protein